MLEENISDQELSVCVGLVRAAKKSLANVKSQVSERGVLLPSFFPSFFFFPSYFFPFSPHLNTN